jgi:hypothetical protein
MSYEVGNCKPPVHSRFQKGQSGNPGGRPGPRRIVERRMTPHLERMLHMSPEDVEALAPRDEFEMCARSLALAFAQAHVPAIRLVLSLVGGRRPRRAERVLCAQIGQVAMDAMEARARRIARQQAHLREIENARRSQGASGRSACLREMKSRTRSQGD